MHTKIEQGGTSEGCLPTKCRVWLANDSRGNRIISDDRWWRLNVTDLLRQEGERRPPITPWWPTAETLRMPIIVVGRNRPVKDMDDALGILKGFRVRLCIEGEKELQILGCGWRITSQFRGKNVLLHHNGKTATMKRKAFNEFLTATKRLRRKRPHLRLVVSNPTHQPIKAAA